jgi:hypothetical protein
MRFPSSLVSISPAARTFALMILAVASFGLSAGCEDKHIGRSCELGTTSPDAGTSGGSVATISSPALECPSRICILPGGDTANTENTGPLCTASCSSNDDCSDGESGPKGDPNDRHCENGFVCMWPTTVGDFACQKLCVCRDFVVEPKGGFQKPTVCN